MGYKIANGVHLHCIPSNKFKDICLSINFISNNTKKDATVRTLLSMMLVDRCQKYKTKKEMSDICDHLYGCTLGSRVVSYGKGHCVEIRSKILDPVYIHENHNIVNDWLNFIQEVVFYPLFEENVFEENKMILKSRILRRLDDSQSYTVSKAFELAGKDEALSIPVRGNMETLETLTLEDVIQAHQELISKNQIEILVCGNFEENQLTKQLQSKLNFNDRNDEIQTYYVLPSCDHGIHKESKDQPQTNIAMVFNTNIGVMDKEYAALKVANGLLGQLPSSFLFQVVREQHSLCYSISSNLISYDSACLISTGIEKENIDKTLNLIHEQIQKCKNGEFEDELVETTKKMLVNALNSSLDEMSSMIGYTFTNALLKRKYSIEENIQGVLNVTKQDCVEVFKKMEHMATFICESLGEAYE